MPGGLPGFAGGSGPVSMLRITGPMAAVVSSFVFLSALDWLEREWKAAFTSSVDSVFLKWED